MKMNPGDWLDKHKEVLQPEIIENFEPLIKYLRGWPLFEKVREPLIEEMLAYMWSNITDPEKVPFLLETLRPCASYYIMSLCAEVEALISADINNLPVDLVNDVTTGRAELINQKLNEEAFSGIKEQVQEMIAIFQQALLDQRKELLDIESDWWKYYKYCFQTYAIYWYRDSGHISKELYSGKKPGELIHLSHQDAFDLVKDYSKLIEDMARLAGEEI